MIESELMQIKERGTFNVFDKACGDIVFAGFQSVSILLWLYAKRGGFIFDPGLGKTLTISGALKLLHANDNSLKCLFFIKKSQITQTAKDVRLYSGLRVVTTTAESDQVSTRMLFRNTDNYDVLMLTHETLDREDVMYFLYENIYRFAVCVVDEAHYLLNYKESDRAMMLEAILPRFERVALLTATPLLTSYEQFAYFLYLLDHVKFKDVSKMVSYMKDGNRLDTIFPLNIYNYDRASLGIPNIYNSIPVFVEPHDFQRGATGEHVLQKTRGEGSVNQVTELIRGIRVQKSRGKKGIVFCYYHNSREYMLPFFDKTDIKYGCIHGNTPQNERDSVQNAFNSGELDVVIISVSEAINLDCDYVYLYQYTVKLKQIIGRAERGINPKIMDLFFMFTLDTGDADYFIENIYKKAEFVRSAIGKEYTEFLELGRTLKEM